MFVIAKIVQIFITWVFISIALEIGTRIAGVMIPIVKKNFAISKSKLKFAR